MNMRERKRSRISLSKNLCLKLMDSVLQRECEGAEAPSC